MKFQTSSREITSSPREITSTRGEWTAAHRHDPNNEHSAVVFVGQHPYADSLETLRRAVSASIDAVYRRTTDTTALPHATHYFFLLDEVDHAEYGLLIEAVRTGARVTLIAKALEPHFAAFVERPNVNIIPVCGDPGPISAATFQRAIAMVLAGERVGARGFVQNSLARHDLDAGDSHPFVAMLNEASLAANTSTTVAAVLALQRTGSNFLHDMIGLSVGSKVRMFHEHDVPGLADAAAHPRPSVDRRFLERDGEHAFRQAALRDAIVTAERRYIFVSDRLPDDRLWSYFVKGRSAWLHRHFDATHSRFRDAAEIQRRFDEWTRGQLDRQRKWYRNKLLRPFGLDVLETDLCDGLFIGRHGPNTLIVVPTVCLSRLVHVVSAAFRTDCYRSLAYNSERESGDEAMGRAFREQFRLDPEVVESLWAIPEVAHIHGERTMPDLEAIGSLVRSSTRG
jgi:hypothetical protein